MRSLHILLLLVATVYVSTETVQVSQDGERPLGAQSQEDDFQYSWITDLARKIKDFILGKGDDYLKTCQKTKAKGGVPSAEHGDSPLDVFGFPYFDERSRRISVKPGVTLSYMFGVRQPIKLGSRDYIISGTAKQLQSFLECFSSYEIIGSSLQPDGHWAAGVGSLKMQLSNVNPTSPRLTDDLWAMIFKISMDRIIKYLDPMRIIEDKDLLIMGGNKVIDTATDMEKLLFKIKEWLPWTDKYLQKFMELYKGKGTLQEKTDKFLKYVKGEEAKRNSLRKQWIGLDNVDKDAQLMITLTMYDKPNNRVRSTYTFDQARVTVADVGKALKLFLSNSKK